jgi:hypothetical protein
LLRPASLGDEIVAVVDEQAPYWLAYHSLLATLFGSGQ